ncbi:MAG: methyltransferase, FxLD system [Chloroflexi bacterium]|nr:methyltransferase, FxLD system [Chloroflexota bacterium]
MDATGTDSHAYRRGLVETLRRDGHLRSARIAEAMQAVPRELFVPGWSLEEIYRPRDAIVTKRIDGASVSSASAPEVVALMLEQLDARPGDHVLEIGAGTGYNAALLAHLVGESGRVVTVDIDEDLVAGARAHLHSAGYGHVTVVQADGALGYRDGPAYDRIMLTVASRDIAPAWHEQLARPFGRLVLPLAVRGLQRCVVFTPEQEHLVCRSPRGCSFIGLRGLLTAGARRVPLDAAGTHVVVSLDEPLTLSAEAIAALLRAPARALSSGVALTLEQLREGLHLWLTAHQPGTCMVWGGAQVPDLFGVQDSLRGTLCVLNSTSLVLLAWADEARRSGELVVLVPRGGEALAEIALGVVREWDRHRRPVDADAVISAHPRGHHVEPSRTDKVVIDQRWTRFVLTWRDQPPASLTL